MGYTPTRGFINKVVGTVPVVFVNLFARVMHQHSALGIETRGVKRAKWRGRVAGRVLQRVLEKARGVDERAGYDTEPWSTRAWIAAIAQEMWEWEESIPTDFDPED